MFGKHTATPLAAQQSVLGALQIQTSSYGVPIPIVYGLNRVAGTMIWYGDFLPIPHTSVQKTGGKGGSGQPTTSTTTYTYQAAVAILLSEGVINGILSMWDTKGVRSTLTATETYTVPSSPFQITVINAAGFVADLGVSQAATYSQAVNDYGDDAPRTLSGTQRRPTTRVLVTPAALQYTVASGLYTFAAADAGKTVDINYSYVAAGQLPTAFFGLSIFTGGRPQGAWGYLTTNHPGQDLGYSGMAYVGNPAVDLGANGSMPNLTFEVAGLQSFGGNAQGDAHPADVIADMLTNATHGVGFPNAYLDANTSFRNFCSAYGLFISPVIDAQKSAASWLADICQITNSNAITSQGILKILPYGDTSAVANGATFIADTQPRYALTLNDFIAEDGVEPITVTRPSPQDANNHFTVEFCNRANSYNPEPCEEKDLAAIDKYGIRSASPIKAHMITTKTVAAAVVNHLLKRSLFIDHGSQFTFNLSWKYCLLEPMDLVTLTYPPLFGSAPYPVRITAVEEDETGELAITAEEFPFAAASPIASAKQAVSAYNPQMDADPGNANAPIIFEATNRLSQYNGCEIYMAVSGANLATWGGCTVHVSPDGTTYQEVGKIYGAARMGVTATATLPATADPDTTDTLHVDLTQSAGTLTSGTVADCDNFRTLCYVGGELISYQNATLTATSKYDLGTRLRRGVYGSTLASHAVGSPFARIDNAIFVFQYDPQWVGKTIFIKLTSFNTQLRAEQSKSAVSATSYTILGLNKGAVDSSTGAILIGTAATPVANLDTGASRANTAIDSGNVVVTTAVDLSRAYVNKNLDNIPNATRAAWDTTTQKAAAVDSSGNLLLKNVGTVTGSTSNPTTASSSYSVIPEMTQTITTKGNKVICLFTGIFSISTGTANVAIFKDGVQISIQSSGQAGVGVPFSVQVSVIDAPTAAGHTYDVRWFTNGGGTITASATSRSFQVVELG